MFDVDKVKFNVVFLIFAVYIAWGVSILVSNFIYADSHHFIEAFGEIIPSVAGGTMVLMVYGNKLDRGWLFYIGLYHCIVSMVGLIIFFTPLWIMMMVFFACKFCFGVLHIFLWKCFETHSCSDRVV